MRPADKNAGIKPEWTTLADFYCHHSLHAGSSSLQSETRPDCCLKFLFPLPSPSRSPRVGLHVLPDLARCDRFGEPGLRHLLNFGTPPFISISMRFAAETPITV